MPGPGDAAAEVPPLATLVDATSVAIDPAAGGEVVLGGARLTVPPGALAASTTFTMWQLDVPDAPGGVSADQRRLFEHAYGFGVDKAVTVAAPLVLSLPVDGSRVGSAIPQDRLHVSSALGGFLVPQEFPVALDTSTASLVVTLDVPELTPGAMASAGAPQAAGVPLLAVLASLARIGVAAGVAAPQVQALGATLDEAQPEWAHDTLETPHFIIRYQRGVADVADVQPVADALERAHALYAGPGGLGFALPNAWNPDGRYAIYIDDFDLHAWPGLTSEADGVTLPGSTLIEGASYVNTNKDPSIWPITAAHEYFHAVTWGIVGQWTPNSLNMLLNPRSGWLFEGTAAAISARVVHGAGTAPARDPAQMGIPTLVSVDDAAIVTPADRAQDFFFHLERAYGNADFYPLLFEGLSTDVMGAATAAARAVDRALNRHGATTGVGPQGLSPAWRSFVEDYVFTSPEAYGNRAEPSNARTRLDECPGSQGYRQGLPALSYEYNRFVIPALEKDANGAILPGQAVDLVIDFGDTDQPPLGVMIELPDGRLIEGTQASLDRSVYPDMRFDNDATVRLVVVNPYFAGDATIPSSWAVCMEKPDREPGWALDAVEYPDGQSLSGEPYCYNCADPGSWSQELSPGGIAYTREEKRSDGSVARAWALDVGIEMPPELAADGTGEVLITAALDVQVTDPVGYPPSGTVIVGGPDLALLGPANLSVGVQNPVDQLVVPFRLPATFGDVAVVTVSAPQTGHETGEIQYVYRRNATAGQP